MSKSNTTVSGTGGRPARVLEPEEICELETLAAILSKRQIAAYFGVTEKTLTAISERQPEVFTAYWRGRARATIKVASALMDAVDRGDMRAIQFYLKTRAGWTERGHGEVFGEAERKSYDVTIEVVDPRAVERKAR